MSNTSKAAVFILAGMAAGVTLGILFAPAKGKENRKKIGDSLLNLGETIKDTATEKLDMLLNLSNSVASQFKADTDIYAYQKDDIEHAII